MKTPVEKQVAAFNKLAKAFEAVRKAVPEIRTINTRFFLRGQCSRQTKYTYFKQP